MMAGPGLAALALAVAGVLLIGLFNGFLIAYADVPAIFATLASGSFVFGFVRSQLITQDAVPVPRGHWLETLGRARLLDIPAEVFVFAGAAFAAYPVPALHQMGPLCLLHGRQHAGGAQHRHSGAADDHAALCDLGADRVRRRASYRLEPAQHQHPRRQLDAALRYRSWSW